MKRVHDRPTEGEFVIVWTTKSGKLWSSTLKYQDGKLHEYCMCAGAWSDEIDFMGLDAGECREAEYLDIFEVEDIVYYIN